MNHQQIKEVVEKYSDIARTFLPSFKTPTVSFYSKGVSAGKATYSLHNVSFNSVLAKENSSTFENIICHEVAHLCTNLMYPYAKQAHGPEFKRIFKAMGGNGETYHSYDVSSVKRKVTLTRVIYNCSCCKEEIQITPTQHKKVRLGGVYRHSICGTVITPVYEYDSKGRAGIKLIKVTK